jgi:hypothetical protein
MTLVKVKDHGPLISGSIMLSIGSVPVRFANSLYLRYNIRT